MEYVGGWSSKVGKKKDSRPLIYKKRDLGGGGGEDFAYSKTQLCDYATYFTQKYMEPY